MPLLPISQGERKKERKKDRKKACFPLSCLLMENIVSAECRNGRPRQRENIRLGIVVQGCRCCEETSPIGTVVQRSWLNHCAPIDFYSLLWLPSPPSDQGSSSQRVQGLLVLCMKTRPQRHGEDPEGPTLGPILMTSKIWIKFWPLLGLVGLWSKTSEN